MRGTACKAGSPLQTKSLFYGYTDYQKGGQKGVLPYFEQDLAAFMLIRGPYAQPLAVLACTRPAPDPPRLPHTYCAHAPPLYNL